jgi:hypothetical protein
MVAHAWCELIHCRWHLDSSDAQGVMAYTGRCADEGATVMTGIPGADRKKPRRPDPFHWMWYALGGGLPERNREWVLHDTTTRTWALRHVLRSFVQLAIPIGLVLLLVPGPFWIRGMAALGGVLLALFFSLAYMTETTENRVKRAGYPAGTAQATRDRLGHDREIEESQRRRAAAERRGARYRARQDR